MKNSTKTPLIVGIGELLWDILPDNTRLGGAPANFAIHCQSLGGKSAIVSAVGTDQPGIRITNQLKQYGITTDYINTNQYQTGKVEIKLVQNGVPQYTISENSAWDHIQLNEKTIRLSHTCDAVCFGTLAQRNNSSQNTIKDFLTNCKQDCLKIFDINLRQNYYTKSVITSSLAIADILKLNDDELDILQPMLNLPKNTDSAIQALLNQYNLKYLALTLGENGSILANRQDISHCPGTPTDICDTIGAGDSFTATVVMGILKGMNLKKINKLANKVAAYVCSQPGATPKLPLELISELNCNTCDTNSNF